MTSFATTSEAQPDDSLTWLHIGAGSFHRAHQAVYLNQLRESGADRRWQLALANIRADMGPLLDALARQQGQYTLETVTPQGERSYQRIAAIGRIIPWDAQLTQLIAAGAEQRTRVISFTVTEGGYYLDHQFRLDTANPDLAEDLRCKLDGSGQPRTIYGAIAAILQARSGAHPQAALTLLNCDNLRHNGERFRDGLLQFLALRGETQLAQWVQEFTTSPNDMVDRITPRPTPAVAARVKAATGVDDPCALMGESFIQWVVEDDFKAGRPRLEQAGVEMVASVLPYEEAKIRILNASHSCIAWAGTLAGLQYIHEGTLRDDIRQMAHDYVTQDVIPCLTPSPIDLAAYRDTTLARFGNPAIQDTNQRVAADGYSKIPGFIRPTLQESLAAGRAPRATAVLPALFFVFLQRWNAGALPYEYQDGIFDPAAARAMLGAADPVKAFCDDKVLWGELAGDERLLALVREGVERVNLWLARQGNK
ncbi:mannitol dehydrogenase family protein [Herbaspirillum sp. LeCh32-8]|uniref:D-arabinitol 4-dehydrogenase n=1 Tax=Herbaspirillum sp. LeCh32-8 TaxID=2821356 RepID=UPI001AEAC35F|nr:D-arabinitol 4-dehydrogenase [Herbaspirillum sp. LeCh32-8]MBP0598408.1 mannitol dehydrogenase family protein [Herbaspirillum sp. LeCh32-8]